MDKEEREITFNINFNNSLITDEKEIVKLIKDELVKEYKELNEREITVIINFNNSLITDEKEIAKAIRDEIKELDL